MKLKLISLLLCVSMLAACLAGCGSEPVKVEVTEAPAPSGTPAPTESPAPTEEPAETPNPEAEARKARFRAAYETYDPDETVMLINDTPITWSQYFSWIYDLVNQLEASYGELDWNEPRQELSIFGEGSSFGSYVKKTARGYILQIAVIGQKAKELGIELTDEQRSDLQASIDGYTEQFGGPEGLAQLMADSFLTMDYFIEQNEAVMLLNNIYQSMYGESGADLPEEDAVAYLKDNGYLYVKHILFRTVDDDRNPLSEEEIANTKAEAEDVLAQLIACPPEDLPERFDALMQQYSEDTGLISYPDGYYFVAGQMVPAFEETVLTLEENGLDLVESEYGYHIIFCPPMKGDHVMGYDSNYAPYTPKAFASAALFDAIANEWYSAAEWNVVYVNDFDQLDLNKLFYGSTDSN